jgi:capsular exopolysaccharide synthesis family protein
MPLELSADACRWLWTQLRYCNVDRTIKTVLVLSATDGEGTTTVAWNLARSAAAAGRKTVVIESDLRTSTLARMPGVATAPGLTELLSGQATLEETLQPADGPTVVVSGSQPPNLRGMLESRAMSELVKRLREDVYEMVIVDAPPLYPSGLPAPLLREVDGILVVARIGTVSRAAAQRLESDLREIGAPVLGVVANDLPVRRRPSLRWART